MNGETLLSKWWQTDSCRQAFERAAAKRSERIQKLQKQVAERKAPLDRDVADWREEAAQ